MYVCSSVQIKAVKDECIEDETLCTKSERNICEEKINKKTNVEVDKWKQSLVDRDSCIRNPRDALERERGRERE